MIIINLVDFWCKPRQYLSLINSADGFTAVTNLAIAAIRAALEPVVDSALAVLPQ